MEDVLQRAINRIVHAIDKCDEMSIDEVMQEKYDYNAAKEELTCTLQALYRQVPAKSQELCFGVPVCGNCNEPIYDGNEYCPSCGTKIERSKDNED